MTDSPRPELSGRYAPPIVAGSPVEIAAGVYVIPDRRVPLVPNVGIIVGERAALIVDTGIGLRNGRHVLEQARRLAGSRALSVCVTQVDPGHGFGVQAFKDNASIIYSTSQLRRLRESAPGYADTFLRFGGEVAALFDNLELVESDLTYSHSLEIDLGGVRAVLRDWGVAHTADDQTVLIDDRVLFGGDLFQTRMFPILPFIPPFDTHFDGDRWIAALDELIAIDIPVVVPGHGEVTDTTQIVAVRENLDYVRAQTRRLLAEGVPVEEAAEIIERASLDRWTNWEDPRWIKATVRAFSTEV